MLKPLAFVLFWGVLSADAGKWVSPCPDLFQYNATDEKNGRWEGFLTIKSEEELSGVWVKLIIDPRPSKVESDFGFITTQGSIFPTSGEYLLRKTNHVLKIGETLNIKLKVEYNATESAPLLVGFRLNGDPVCPDDKIIDPNRLPRPAIQQPSLNPDLSLNFLWDSPCPQLFQYVSNTSGEWVGNFTINAEEELNGIWIRLTLDPKPVSVSSDFGHIDIRTSAFSTADDYLIRRPNSKLLPGEVLRISLKVVYDPGQETPLLIGFRLNGDPICPDDKIIDPSRITREKPRKTRQVSWESPCPNLFQYDLTSIKSDEWSGDIILTTEEEIGGVWVRLTLDPRPLSVEADLGFIDPKNSSFETSAEYLIRKTNKKLSPGEILRIRLRVKHNPNSPPPLLVGFRLNGDPICPDDKIIDPNRLPRPAVQQPSLNLDLLPPTSAWESPCPQFFQYVSNATGEWLGDFTISTEEELNGIWVRLTLDPKPVSVASDFGVIDSRTSAFPTAGEYLIRKTNSKLLPGEVLRIRLKVVYDPAQETPLLIGFRLNGDPVCPDDKIIDPNRVVRPTAITPPPRPTIDLTPPPIEPTSPQPPNDLTPVGPWESPCPQLFHYESTKPGEWSGELTLSAEEELGGIWVRLTLDPKPTTVEADLGVVDPRSSVFPTAAEYLIRKTNTKLLPGEVLRIKLKVGYDQSKVTPLLVGFRLNGDPVCPEDKIIDPNRVSRPTELSTTPPKLEAPQVGTGDAWESPCPGMFSYDLASLKADEWTGIINLQSEEELGGIWVRLTIDPKPIDVTTDFGRIDPRVSAFPTSGEYLIRKTNERLKPGQVLQIKFTVKFDPKGSTPILIGYRLNGDPVCPDDKIIDPNQRPNRVTPIPQGISTTPIPNQSWISPCPNLFQYDPTSFKAGEWSGDVTLMAEEELGGIWVRLTIDPKPLSVETDFGTTDPRASVYPTSGDYLIRKTNQRLNPGQVLRIRITVKYDPSTDIPLLAGFRLNGDPVCPDDKIIDPSRLQRPYATTPTTYRPPVTTVGIPFAPEAPGVPVVPEAPGTSVVPAGSGFFSPCPEIFKYDSLIEDNRWFGRITWTSNIDMNGINAIKIILDNEASQIGNWYGETITTDNKEYIIFGQTPIRLGEVLDLKFYVRYRPAGPVPKLKAIIVNDRTICGSIRLATDDSSAQNVNTSAYSIQKFANYTLINVKKGTGVTNIRVDKTNLPIIIL